MRRPHSKYDFEDILHRVLALLAWSGVGCFSFALVRTLRFRLHLLMYGVSEIRSTLLGFFSVRESYHVGIYLGGPPSFVNPHMLLTQPVGCVGGPFNWHTRQAEEQAVNFFSCEVSQLSPTHAYASDLLEQCTAEEKACIWCRLDACSCCAAVSLSAQS